MENAYYQGADVNYFTSIEGDLSIAAHAIKNMRYENIIIF
jgi:hypothetical protein